MKKRITSISLLLILTLIIPVLYENVSENFTTILISFALFLSFTMLYYKPKKLKLSDSFPSGNKTKENPLISIAQKDIVSDTNRLSLISLSNETCHNEWSKTEKIINDVLDQFLMLINSRIDANTIAVFFPLNEEQYTIRRYHSKTELVNSEAVINPGVGILGNFFKNGLKPLNLSEIPNDSITLYYYKKDASVRSLMASPIIVNGVERGAIIVDSKKKNHFCDEDHAYLNTTATILGQSVYSTYMHTEHRLEHARFASMSNIEKEFFRNLDLDTILDTIMEVILLVLSYDRLTISTLDESCSQATIVRVAGADSNKFLQSSFDLTEKSLASIVYSKNLSFFRNYAKDHYEIRYFKNEPKSEQLQSFMALPIGVAESRGMILIESQHKNFYTQSSLDLVSRLATSAGLAIEKYAVLKEAENQATHDGLTSLLNHREFQNVLSDEITRSIRYNDPLILVLCDIDHFKKLNDTYGHQFGDEVLKGIANRLKISIRDGIDISARYGGEEFALILVKTDDSIAIETVERIRQKISSECFKAPNGDDVQVTMSFGIAQYGKDARHMNDLIKKADKALYRAKDKGRNRIELF
ncbi:diguanylate cyclase [Chitinispirillales bacterium ANBcel5]|uniref:sensor domain-containing diguanylate cyclase n=1 Tax=Cellulosispirillum alkaliphilum TaxID=3039283 RepID=UPI002A50A7CD|nr:diguanylate cyclase [Chitinispirillales bacterium ANBcel5]